MTHAAALLMRDLNGAAAPVAEAPGPFMFPLLPVADLVICELRKCRGCGHVKAHTSSRVFRLLSSCESDPFKRILRLRKAEEAPLDRRCVRVVEVLSDHCQECWKENTSWEEAVAIVPKRPHRSAFTVTAAPAPAVQAKAAPNAISRMTAAEAAEAL